MAALEAQDIPAEDIQTVVCRMYLEQVPSPRQAPTPSGRRRWSSATS